MQGKRFARARRLALGALAAVLAAASLPLVTGSEPAAAAVPSGFQELVAFDNLINPMAVRFAPDGRIFVAEKRGVVKEYDSLSDTSPTQVLDIRTRVYNFWDRGLLDIALHPNFPATPYLYLLYTRDAVIGGAPPRWGTPNTDSDPCPTPPGPTGDGCVVSGRLSRISLTGSVATGAEEVLIDDWCQQYPTHSVGSLAFGADGMLYVTGGEGANFDFVDYGQVGAPVNPCGDPPGGPGDDLTPPTAEGGALRSQDVRTTGDPTGLDGTVLRLNPTTGAAATGNPMIGSADVNARRIVGYGLRNPFRMTIRPGTNDVWLGDVGWDTWEEINRLPGPTDGTADNFGWPCYEGSARQSGYDSANLNICENLYSAGAGAVSTPQFAYRHNSQVTAGDGACPTDPGSSISGIAFNPGGQFPAEYNNALFFADYSRNCIWVVPAGTNGLPDFSQRRGFARPASTPVNLVFSPSGEMFYPDFDGGTVRRIRWVGVGGGSVTCAPGTFRAQYFNNATLTGTPAVTRCESEIDHTWDGTPVAGVNPNNFSVRWVGDFNFNQGVQRFSVTGDDGVRLYVDNVLLVDKWIDQGPTTYTANRNMTSGTHQVKVEFYDRSGGAVARASWRRATAGTSPVAYISTPSTATKWRVGQTLNFSGGALDPEDGGVPAAALKWSLILRHCPGTCHSHALNTWDGIASGSFAAPDHSYPSHLLLRLTATDSDGNSNTSTRRIDPRTVSLRFESTVPGLKVNVGSTATATPFRRTVIVGSNNSVSAPEPQTQGPTTFEFRRWSDNGAATHNITAPASSTRYTATFRATRSVIGRFDFAPVGSREVDGYVIDAGGAYGTRGALRYGWEPQNRANVKRRGSSASPDVRYDSFAFMQRSGNHVWELAVKDGRYEVIVAAGDPESTNGHYKIVVEGTKIIDLQPTSGTRFANGKAAVVVSDGRLTVRSAAGAVNNKISFITVHRLF